jgi:trehalose 6-phosphate phosphatase
LDDIRKTLVSLASADARLLLEDKGLSVALHYRRAPERAADIQAEANRLLAEVGDDVDLIAGKCVVEFRRSGASKGNAIRRFQSIRNFSGRRPVMIGDDVTDEDGFDAVNEQDGISILVGNRPDSRARFSLPTVSSVHDWLSAAC